MNIKEKFGLDYLGGGGSSRKLASASQQSRRGDLPPGMEEALLAYGRRIPEVLRGEPEQQARVLDLAKQLRIRIDTLMPVVQYLVERGYLTRVEEDPTGNDLVKLTAASARLLA